ncbi:MAG TPA: T9SS type A sorting domain-containing protein, partial [Flavobacteriales bacterium]|nr:T9SS type A sorting domain-containing protein [Flavobacteriales bacterium]
FDGLGTSTATDTSFTFPGPGSFYVCLNAISDSGCNALFCQNITITGLNETGDENTLTIYPNPATDYITVNGKYTVLIIRNGLGDNVINKEHLNGSERLYIGQLPAGVYSLVVDNKRSYKLLISAR